MIRVGIDIVDVERIKRLHEQHGDRFLGRVFTATEIEYALSARGDRKYERLAVRLTAKEAVN